MVFPFSPYGDLVLIGFDTGVSLAKLFSEFSWITFSAGSFSVLALLGFNFRVFCGN